MHSCDAGFKDLVAACAADTGTPLLRGPRSRDSTDGAVPVRHGHPTATLVSVDARKLIPPYHLNSGLSEHVDYRCVAGAATLAEAVARRLDRGSGVGVSGT